MLELLNILKETENDDITNVVQKVIAIYYDKLAPIMYEICQNLVGILTNKYLLMRLNRIFRFC